MHGRVVTFGGTGFVGSKIVEKLAQQGYQVTAVSRRGKCPPHLMGSKDEWMQRVDWVSGDAFSPDAKTLSGAAAVVTLIGEPPLPTFTQAAFDRAVAFNGTANKAVIEAAKESGVNTVVLVSADVPWILQSEKFGYYVGKKIGFRAAEDFSSEEDHTAYVLRPGAIYGTRHLAGGTPIPLGIVMGPLAFIQRFTPSVINRNTTSFVSVDQVAQVALECVMESPRSSTTSSSSSSSSSLHIIDAEALAAWPLP